MKKVLLLLFVLVNCFLSVHANWVQTNGPVGGTINCLITINGIVYAGTTNGVFGSNNSGASWNSLNTGLNKHNDPTIVYSIVNIAANIFIGTSEGVYLSSNQGNSWIAMNGAANSSLPNASQVYTLAVVGSDLFAGLSINGIYRSSNNGFSWTAANNGIPTNYAVKSIVANGSYLFAGSYGGGILRSNNNGSQWLPVPYTGVANSDIICMAVVGNFLFASLESSIGLLKSGNNGASFVISSSGLGTNTPRVNTFLVNGTDIYIGTLDNNVYKSTNNGNSWIGFSTIMPISGYYNGILALAISGSNILAGTNGKGVYLSSNNGINWIASNINLFNTEVQALVKVGSVLLAGTKKMGIFKSSDDGNNWFRSSSGIINEDIKALKAIGPVIYACVNLAGIYKTIDTGGIWTAASFGIPNSEFYCFANDSTNLYTGTSNGFFISANGGANWNFANNGLPNFTRVNTIAISGNDIYIGTGAGIYKSTNQAASWTLVCWTPNAVTQIAISGINIYAGLTAGGILLSTNNGGAWSSINTGLSSNFVPLSLSSKDANVFVGCYDGMFRTSIGNTKWIPFSAGFNLGTNVTSLASDSNFIFAGTESGVWKNNLDLCTEICIVTVDDASQHNLIVWEKALVTNIDSFRIFREDITGVDSYLASVGFNDLSQYTDTENAANPNFLNSHYKLQEKRSDGSLSGKSIFHNSIFLQNNDSLFYWNSYEVEGQRLDYPIIQYKLMCDYNGSGVWTVISIQPANGNNGTVVVPAYSLYPNARYRLIADMGSLACAPTMPAAPLINYSQSNIISRVNGIQESSEIDSKISLQPNPANDNITINFSINVSSICIFDNLGRLIIQKNIDSSSVKSITIDISGLKDGIYTVLCSSKNFDVRKKLIVG
ncbi:MAG: T9SS type A sorting domain-containing protein [Bacteroidetes bacterium]|nr:T9SS type A sorting domain-containing protein [Bacteroidota bacterium]